jgi:hemerythrin-like domain-containing protein
MASSPPRADVLAQVIRDHREVEERFQQFELYDDTSAVGLKRDMFDKISRALSIHVMAEEQVIYPIVRAEIPGGAALADEALADHRQVAEALVALGRMAPTDAGFVVGVNALAGAVRRHVADEERELLPLLAKHLRAPRLQELGKAFTFAETVAPTRPHPGLPDRPPANVVVGLATSLVDRVRDVVDVAADRGRKVVEDFEKKDGPTRT